MVRVKLLVQWLRIVLNNPLVWLDEDNVFTCAEAIEACGFGWFQIRLSFFAGLLWVWTSLVECTVNQENFAIKKFHLFWIFNRSLDFIFACACGQRLELLLNSFFTVVLISSLYWGDEISENKMTAKFLDLQYTVYFDNLMKWDSDLCLFQRWLMPWKSWFWQYYLPLCAVTFI